MQSNLYNHTHFASDQSEACGLNKFFISFNLILCLIVSVVSVLPRVQEALPNSGLLQSSVVTLYTIYLTWSAVANNPDRQCNHGFFDGDGDHSKVTFDTSSIVGLIVWMVCILYSSLRSASKVAGIPDIEKQGECICWCLFFVCVLVCVWCAFFVRLLSGLC